MKNNETQRREYAEKTWPCGAASGLHSPKLRGSGLCDEGEFDAAAHGVDPFCTDAHAVAVLPHQLLRFCAATPEPHLAFRGGRLRWAWRQ